MKRILIIEDHEETLNNLKSEFEKSGLETICCSDFNSAKSAVENNIPFDVVILDWYFVLEQSCEYSLQLLRLLKKKLFIPVFVYTGHLSDFENKSEEELGYPKNIISGIDKMVTYNDLKNRIESLTKENLTLQLARNYREKIHQNLEKIFFELNDSENSSLGKILKTIYGDGENIDWNNDVIMTLLHRNLISDDGFTGTIKKTLKNISDNTGNDANFNRRLLNKIIYHHGKSDYIRNGDIVGIKNSDNNNILCYGIVTTPDCDLENKSCRQIELIEIRKINDSELGLNNDTKSQIKNNKHDSLYYIPSLLKTDNDYEDFVAILKNKLILTEKEIQSDIKYPKASKRPLYSHTFIFNQEEVKLELICTKVNPYKAEFLHKVHSHNSRVGIPDIKKLL